MPFRTLTFDDGELDVGDDVPAPELRQTGPRSFRILKSFCYRAPRGDPDEGTLYVVPGADFPEEPEPPSGEKVVIPPDREGMTDLASVPSVFWWLIASYGNHTRASLLHDVLYVDKGTPPVPRRTADRLFLSALREPGQKKAGPFRHWLMWAAVSAFGTMRFKLGILFGLHVVVVWALTISGLVWAWGDGVAGVPWTWWQVLLGGLAALAYLFLLGTSWRAGVDLQAGWVFPLMLGALLILVPLATELSEPIELLSPFTLLVAAGLLTLAGPLWGLWVDPTLRGWLWPTALMGLPIAVIPAALVIAALLLVALIDLGAEVAAWIRGNRSGAERPFDFPTVKQARLPY